MKRRSIILVIILVMITIFTGCENNDLPQETESKVKAEKLIKIAMEDVTIIEVDNYVTTEEDYGMKTINKKLQIDDSQVIQEFYELLNSEEVYGDIDQETVLHRIGELNILTFNSDSQHQNIAVSTNLHAIEVRMGDDREFFGYERIEAKFDDGTPSLFFSGRKTEKIRSEARVLVESQKETYTEEINYRFEFYNNDSLNLTEIELDLKASNQYKMIDWNAIAGGELILRDGKYFFLTPDNDTVLSINFNRE